MPRDHESYVVRAQAVFDDERRGGFRKYWPKVHYLQQVPTDDIARADTAPQQEPPQAEDKLQPTKVVDIPNTVASFSIDTKKKTRAGDVIALDDLMKLEEEEEDDESDIPELNFDDEGPSGTEDRKRAIMEAMRRKRLGLEEEDDDDEEESGGSNGRKW